MQISSSHSALHIVRYCVHRRVWNKCVVDVPFFRKKKMYKQKYFVFILNEKMFHWKTENEKTTAAADDVWGHRHLALWSAIGVGRKQKTRTLTLNTKNIQRTTFSTYFLFLTFFWTVNNKFIINSRVHRT